MKKSVYFVFGSLFTISMFLTIWAFEVADLWRGYNGLGGEVFTVALPLILVWKIVSIAEQNERILLKRLKRLQEQEKERSRISS